MNSVRARFRTGLSRNQWKRLKAKLRQLGYGLDDLITDKEYQEIQQELSRRQ